MFALDMTELVRTERGFRLFVQVVALQASLEDPFFSCACSDLEVCVCGVRLVTWAHNQLE